MDAFQKNLQCATTYVYFLKSNCVFSLSSIDLSRYSLHKSIKLPTNE